MRTGMPAILEAHRARWAAAEGIIAVMAIGPALVAVATLALIAVLASRRRRATMSLARSRGASGRQVFVPVIVEGLLVAVPGAVIAALLAIALIPSGTTSPTVVAAAAVVAIAVVIVTSTVVSIVRSRGPGRRDGDRVVGRVSTRRLVLEGLFVALAIGAAYLLRERGLSAVSSAGSIGGFDPLIAAVPVLVGIAAGIVVVRLYPLALRLVAAVARRGRGLVLVLAARRATEGGTSSAVLLVLLATATVAAFAATSLDSLDSGAEVAAWQTIGGSYRLQAPTGALPADVDADALPGVTVSAGVFEGTRARRGVAARRRCSPSPTPARWPRRSPGPPPTRRSRAGFTTPGSGPIPAIISTSLAEAPRGVKLGDEFTSSIEGYALKYKVVEVRDGFAGLPRNRSWVVVAAGVVQGAGAGGPHRADLGDRQRPVHDARRDARRGDRDVAHRRHHEHGRAGRDAAHRAGHRGRPRPDPRRPRSSPRRTRPLAWRRRSRCPGSRGPSRSPGCGRSG